jgi:hypothetical protein
MSYDTAQTELLKEFGVTELFQISEKDFYRALGEKYPSYSREYNDAVGAWSESVNARKRANGGVL